MITITTVGYGDFSAKSHCGRCIAVLSGVWGNINMSLFVLAITNLTLFDPSQQKSYRLLTLLSLREDQKKAAVGALKSGYKIMMLKKEPAKKAQERRKRRLEEYE